MKFTKIKIIFFSLLLINLTPFFCFAEDNTYKPMEGIPGLIKANEAVDFPQYLMAIYKFGLWAIGMSAVFMIMIGGYMYLTSAGNNSQTGKAKGIITDAIAGVILALVSYVLLYTINPELVQFKPLKGITSTPLSSSEIKKGDGSVGGTIAENYAKACPAGDDVVEGKSVVADFSKASSDSKTVVDPTCATLIPSSVGGVNVKILRTIAQIESTCGKGKLESGKGACGVMQLKPDTASNLAGRTITCQELKSDSRLSIDLAAKYISQSGYQNDPEKVFAGYNSGYGKGLTSEGKKPALYPSSDCPGKSAFECCENPGELKETISYVWNALGLMNKQ